MNHGWFRCHFIPVDNFHKFIPNTVVQWIKIGTIWWPMVFIDKSWKIRLSIIFIFQRFLEEVQFSQNEKRRFTETGTFETSKW